MSTHLYRHFDQDGVLLYVGISLNAIQRLSQHRDHSSWFGSIARVEIKTFETREAAMEAERVTIANENPKYNVRRPPPTKLKKKVEESRADLVARIVSFKPMYSIAEVANILQISEKWAKHLTNTNRLRYVLIYEGTRNTRFGPRPVREIGITGFQLLEFIEALDAGTAKIMDTAA